MIPQTKIGIIGGGQLGKMMTQAAKQMGFYVKVLDPTINAPGSQVADETIIADFFNQEKIRELVESSDITTFDIEHIDTEILKKLEDEGHKIFPSPKVLEQIQDKLVQNQLFEKNGLPLPKFREVEDPSQLLEALQNFKYPVVQKARKGGYDGKGVVILKEESDLQNAIKAESLLEECVEIEKELAVNIAQNTKGEIKVHQVVEMTFDPKTNICDLVIGPAQISKDHEEKALQIAKDVLKSLGEGAYGNFAIEMFLTKDGEILVNEVAPRPHNSGHYTIEACITSQFEQHIRAITGLPLGSTKLHSPTVMKNLLGPENYSGPVKFDEAEELLAIDGLSVHLYGKEDSKPFRKLGHITVLDDSIEGALAKIDSASKIIAKYSQN